MHTIRSRLGRSRDFLKCGTKSVNRIRDNFGIGLHGPCRANGFLHLFRNGRDLLVGVFGVRNHLCRGGLHSGGFFAEFVKVLSEDCDTFADRLCGHPSVTRQLVDGLCYDSKATAMRARTDGLDLGIDGEDIHLTGNRRDLAVQAFHRFQRLNYCRHSSFNGAYPVCDLFTAFTAGAETRDAKLKRFRVGLGHCRDMPDCFLHSAVGMHDVIDPRLQTFHFT